MIPAMKELFKWHKHHRKNGGTERLGQFFYNTYCKPVSLPAGMVIGEDASLKGVHAANDKDAAKIVEAWLITNNYIETLPKPLRPVGNFNTTAA